MLLVPNDLSDKKRLRVFLDAVRDNLADQVFVKRFSAADFYTQSGSVNWAVSSTGGVPRTAHWGFNDAATGSVELTLPRPKQWINGDWRLKLYTSGVSGNSAQDVYWNYLLVGHAEDGDLTTGTVLRNREFALAGPATARYGLTEEEFNDSNPITADYDLLSLVVRRLGAHASDTYAAVALFTALELEYIPRTKQ